MDKGGQEKEGEEPEGGRRSTSYFHLPDEGGGDNRIGESCGRGPVMLQLPAKLEHRQSCRLAPGGGIRPHTEKSKFFAGLSDFFHIYIWKRVH